MSTTADFTEDDLKRINAAIASGAMKVEYNDRVVHFKSTNDLLKQRELIRRCLGKVKVGGNRILCKVSKGLC